MMINIYIYIAASDGKWVFSKSEVGLGLKLFSAQTRGHGGSDQLDRWGLIKVYMSISFTLIRSQWSRLLQDDVQLTRHIIGFLEIGALFLQMSGGFFVLLVIPSDQKIIEALVSIRTTLSGLIGWFAAWAGDAFTYASDCNPIALFGIDHIQLVKQVIGPSMRGSGCDAPLWGLMMLLEACGKLGSLKHLPAPQDNANQFW